MADVDTLDREDIDVDRPIDEAEQQEEDLKKIQAIEAAEDERKLQESLAKDGLTGNKAAEEARRMSQKLEKYIDREKRVEQKGAADPGGEVLKLEVQWDKDDKEKKDPKKTKIVLAPEQKDTFRFWGWSDEALQFVREDIQAQLDQVNIELSPEQEKLILGLLMATGQTPKEIVRLLPNAYKKAEHLLKDIKERDIGGNKAAYTARLFFNQLGIRDDYAERFILAKEFRSDNDTHYNHKSPGNIEELAYQMAYKDQDTWGLHGDFPTLELRIVTGEGKKIDNRKSRLYINEANVRRWGVERQHHQYDIAPTATPDYFQAVKIEKESSMYHITLGAMFDSEKTIFKSEDSELDYGELEMQMQIDPWIMGIMRQYYRTYENEMAKDTKISEVLGGMFYMSELTKKTFGKNMLYYMSTLPLNFESSKKGEFTTPDNIVGSAMNDMLLSYMHISDFPELEKVLGRESSFFTKEGMERAMEKVFADQTGMSGSVSGVGFLRDASVQLLKDSFVKVVEKNEKGEDVVVHRVVDTSKEESEKTPDEKAADKARIADFVKFVNFFGVNAEDSNKMATVRQALKDAMQERYRFEVNGKFDKYTLFQAELIAHSCTNWSGIGSYNDTGASAFNAQTKFLRTAQYRLKMATPERGGPAGNPNSIFLFKELAVPFFYGLSTTSKDYHTGINKPPGQVFHEIQQAGRMYRERISTLEKEIVAIENDPNRGKSHKEWHEKKYELDLVNKKFAEEYRAQAGQLAFNNDAMRDYAFNHFDRASKLWAIVSGAQEIEFEKFMKHDQFGRVTINKAALQKEVQKEYFTPIRYMVQTYGDLDYRMPFRAPKLVKGADGSWKTVWETMPLGEALFGYELLDRKEFWKTEDPKEDGEKKQSRWRKRKKSKYVYDANGRHAIDWDKVQKDKVTLWKNWAVMKLAADFRRHVDRSKKDRSAFDVNYHPTHYLHILEALESIPGGIDGDEYNMGGVEVTKSFLSHEDINILKKKAKIGTGMFWAKYYWDYVIRGKDDKDRGIGGLGFKEAIALIAKHSFAVK